MVIKNGTVLCYDRLLQGNDLRVVDGTIAEIGPEIVPGATEHVCDAEGGYVLPGLIDLHSHGLEDNLVQTDSLIEFSRLQLSHGVTTCVPTLQGTPRANAAVMRRGISETNRFNNTPNLIGFRPEIMYVAKTGAGSRQSLVPIHDSTTQLLWEASEGTIRIWDVAPELKGALDFVRWAAAHGIVTSIAHSSATIDQARRCVDAGLSLVTHCFATFDVPRESDPGVYPAGLIDYLLVDDRVTLELIPDGVHVHPLLMEKAFRCKGIERVALVTDSVKGAGNPPGIYPGLYDGAEVEVTEDRGMRRTADDCLSGSALTHIASLRNAVMRFGKSLAEASALCSLTPARVLGLRNKGYVAVGMDADLIIVDQQLSLRNTICAGAVVYPRS